MLDFAKFKLANRRVWEKTGGYMYDILNVSHSTPYLILDTLDPHVVQLENFKFNGNIKLHNKTNNAAVRSSIQLISDLRKKFYEHFCSAIQMTQPATHQTYKFTYCYFEQANIPNLVEFENKKINVSLNILQCILKLCKYKLDVRLDKLFVGSDDFTLSFKVVRVIVVEIPPKLESYILSKSDSVQGGEIICTQHRAKMDTKNKLKQIIGLI